MQISVVVLTCNQRQMTLRCLRSLADYIVMPECELILVDNGSSDGTAEAVAVEFPQVRIVAFKSNIGVAAGRNAGLRHALGEYLMILDNDTIASADTIIGLADYLKKHPEVGLVAPRLVSPNGETQTSFKRFPGLGIKIRNVIRGKGHNSIAKRPPKKISEPFYLIGAAQMFPRDVFEMAGPLDEHIFYGPEDADFCMAVRSMWKKVVYNPNFTIIHDWQRSTTSNILSRGARRHMAGLLYFYFKHKRIF